MIKVKLYCRALPSFNLFDGFFQNATKILLYVLRLSVSVRNMLSSCNRQVTHLRFRSWQHKAVMVKSQLWPTPSESIAIYCARKLGSCVTRLQSLFTMILKGRMFALSAILLLFFCLMLRKVVMFSFYDTSLALQVSRFWTTWAIRCKVLRVLCTTLTYLEIKQGFDHLLSW